MAPRTAALATAAALLALASAGCGGARSGGAAHATPAAAASKAAAKAPEGGAQAKGRTAEVAPADPRVLAALPARLDADGTTITVGNPKAHDTIDVYEDPRCPICQSFELVGGPRLAELAHAGTLRVRYTLASFLDANLGGSGSRRSVNALRAALALHRFPRFHELLYANQPDESVDGFTDRRLVQIAGHVPGLKTAAFERAIQQHTYRAFVAASERAFEHSGAPGTPYVRINGRVVNGKDADLLHNPARFDALLRKYGVRGVRGRA
jgi:protein-disulfide isomerase